MKRNAGRKVLFLLCICVCSVSLFAQVRGVRGTIMDASGEPVIGANIVEKGTMNGTVSDIDGRFSL